MRTRAIGLVASWLATSGVAAVARAAPPETEVASPAMSDDERKQAARAEVAAAKSAFAAGDLEGAIGHYEAAMDLLPAPKLHYNIGVCHQRLALQAETSQQRTLHRDLAIDSYNTYLEQNPRADDRLEVADTIRELGGVPVTMPSLMKPV